MASSPSSSPVNPSPPSSSPSPPAPSIASPPPNSSSPPSDTSTPPPSIPDSPPPPSATPPPSTTPPPKSSPPPSEPPPKSSPPSSEPPPATPPPSSSPPPPTLDAPPPSPPVADTPPASISPTPSKKAPPAASPPPPDAKPSPPPPPDAKPSPPPSDAKPSPPPPPNAKSSPPPPGPDQGSPPADSPPPSNDSPPSTDASSTPPPSAPSPSGSNPSPPTPPSSTPSTPSNSSSTNSTALPTPTSKSTTPITSSAVPSTSTSSSDTAVKVGVAVGVVGLLIVLGFMGVVMFVRRQRRRKQKYNPYILPSPYASSQGSGSLFLQNPSVSHMQGPNSGGDYMPSSGEGGTLGNSRTWFAYEELADATDGFAEANILGVGGFGCVYKGYLGDGREIAVKKLKAGGGQGDREFKAEVEIISRVHHRYLVSLVGYCINEYERLLVYEFVPNNTLHYHLHAANKPAMEWSLRLKVAAGSARGIAYLHEDCHPRIIHRDIKSANILLDNNFEAKVADFGLAKLAEELDLNTHVSTRVMGTFGYMAPEYASSGKLSEKSDVYSFGVVLLELITGRKPVDETQPLGDESLVEWARPLMTQALDNEDFDELADPKLGGNYVRSEMFRMIEAAAACVRHSASKRPKMSQVVRALDLAAESSSDLSNGMRPGQSGIIDSREQSAQIRNFQRMAFGSQDSSDFFNNSQASWRSGRTGL